MRRLLALLGCAAATALGAGIVLTPAHAGGDYRVDVVFDDAHGLIPGQLVQIAGARVGTIEDVTLTQDFKARVQMKVESRFAPFRKDARCTIRPQGLIAENFVDCEPGSPDAPALQAIGDNPPTVPVSRTTAPVPVTELFDIWNAPVRDRLTLLVNGLGIGTAGRGEDFNAILRRANPSLALARKVIGVLHRQRAQLATVLDNTDEIVGRLADNGGRVRDFVDEAARTTAVTGAHSRQLSDTVRRLPALLDATEPALRDLDRVVRTGTPLVHQLRVAAPDVNRLTADIGPFARQTRPTLEQLGPVLAAGTRTLKRSVPVTRLVRSYAHNSRAAAELVGPLFTNLRDRGFVENLLTVFYRAAAATARFDDVSHIFPAFVKLNACILPATTPSPGCSANFTNTATSNATARTKRKAAPQRTRRPVAPATTTPSAPATPDAPATPATPLLPSDPVGAVKKLIDSVLHPGGTAPAGGDERNDRGTGLGGLLGYLLG